jgi:hypothetical protein
MRIFYLKKVHSAINICEWLSGAGVRSRLRAESGVPGALLYSAYLVFGLCLGNGRQNHLCKQSIFYPASNVSLWAKVQIPLLDGTFRLVRWS